MNFENLKQLYNKKREQLGSDTYKYVSELLREAKEMHWLDWKKNQTPRGDHEQSWRAFKGKNLEKLIIHIIEREIEALGLKMIEGSRLERTKGENLTRELSLVKRNLLIDYDEFGAHLPDVDIVIYNPETSKTVAVISSKVTLRERIAQTGYWKIKLASDKVTEHIKVYFVTPDEDGNLTFRKPTKKGRAIVEVDTDGSYVLSETDIEESDKVKMFDKFIGDIRKMLD